MSYIVSIFFNAPDRDELDHVIAELKKLWKIDFKTAPADPHTFYRYEGLGLLVDVLDDHGMENDRDMHFTEYRYWISVEATIRVDERYSSTRSMAIYFAHQLFERFRWPCMVVVSSYTL